MLTYGFAQLQPKGTPNTVQKHTLNATITNVFNYVYYVSMYITMYDFYEYIICILTTQRHHKALACYALW